MLRSVCLALFFAGLMAATLHLSLGDMNLNLADEGYLWYGVKGVLAGEVPFRDFQAYDPGRYRWCAVGSWFFGSGILGVRASLAVFQALGLAAGLLVARRFLKHDLWMLPVAIILGLWMFPRHKLFEPALAMIVLWSCVRLLECPSKLRHLAAGLCVGLVAWFGRNHGLYAGLGMGAAWGYLAWKRPATGWAGCLGALACGVALGYLPMLANLAFIPGFAEAYWHELTELASKGANLPQPWPWPWSADWGPAQNTLEQIAQGSTTLAFALPLLILPAALWKLFRLKRDAPAPLAPHGLAPEQAALVGSAIIGLIYLHHASIRSDAQHLGQCVQPLLLAGLALATGRRMQVTSMLILSCITFFFSFQNHSTLRFFAPWKPGYQTIAQEVAGESLRLNGSQARYIKTLTANVGGRLKPADQIFIAPTRATFYPLLGKRAPVREIYLLWPASQSEQEAMIASLEEQSVRWALVLDTTVDDRDDLRFANSHPLVLAYLQSHFSEVPIGMGSSHRLLRRNP